MFNQRNKKSDYFLLIVILTTLFCSPPNSRCKIDKEIFVTNFFNQNLLKTKEFCAVANKKEYKKSIHEHLESLKDVDFILIADKTQKKGGITTYDLVILFEKKNKFYIRKYYKNNSSRIRFFDLEIDELTGFYGTCNMKRLPFYNNSDSTLNLLEYRFMFCSEQHIYYSEFYQKQEINDINKNGSSCSRRIINETINSLEEYFSPR